MCVCVSACVERDLNLYTFIDPRPSQHPPRPWPLQVKGCKDLIASFDEYMQEETLDGDNQYHSERYGKQDAKKGVAFKSLPPVLELHLRRFEYDFSTDQMVKINERFEFPTTLDLDREVRHYIYISIIIRIRTFSRCVASRL